jgi:hypothetical protein
MAEMHESGVMANMSVRQKHSVKSEIIVRSHPVELIELLADIGRRIKQILVV